MFPPVKIILHSMVDPVSTTEAHTDCGDTRMPNKWRMIRTASEITDLRYLLVLCLLSNSRKPVSAFPGSTTVRVTSRINSRRRGDCTRIEASTGRSNIDIKIRNSFLLQGRSQILNHSVEPRIPNSSASHAAKTIVRFGRMPFSASSPKHCAISNSALSRCPDPPHRKPKHRDGSLRLPTGLDIPSPLTSQ